MLKFGQKIFAQRHADGEWEQGIVLKCDLPMIFHNTDKVICMHEPTPIKLGLQMSKCWATFARTGDPNHEFIGEWKPYDAGEEYTMVFGEENRCVKNFDRELLYKNWEYTPNRSFFGGNRKKHPL